MSTPRGDSSIAARLQDAQARLDLQLRINELRVEALKIVAKIAEKGEEITKLQYDYSIRHAQLHNAEAECRLARIVAYRKLAENKD
jgi:hypothetical protein